MANEKIMITVGGGYVSIQEYYEKHAYKQCVQFYSMLKRNRFTFLQGLIHMLESRNASPDVVRSYQV